MRIPTKILVPTDFSKFSYKALEQALDIARICKAKMFCLHVLDGGTYNADEDFVVPKDVAEQLEDDSLACAKERLQNQLVRFPQAKEMEVDISIREGVPYEEILKEAKEQGIDMIVIASLGQSGNAQYLIGRVARNVLKEATCSVLLTK
jgi:nucleotide-binding universal stress UspA family protein